jgi:multidrug efflux system membrane fusion protein
MARMALAEANASRGTMPEEGSEGSTRTPLGIALSAAIVALAVITGALLILDTSLYPRTDDAEVFANFIGMAPLVEGPVMHLYVHDNQYVKQGQLLYEIDDRPYLYALQRAKSEQAALEGQIRNAARGIAAQQSGVEAAQAAALSAEANAIRADAAIEEAEADVRHAEALVKQTQAESEYASDNYHRLEPLLGKQYVTADQVDQARAAAAARTEAERQAESQLALSRARLAAMQAAQKQAQAAVSQSHAQVTQSSHAVEILDPLVAQREARAAAVERAQYDYDNCRVYAPFDARVTNLIISEGAYAHVGQQLFTLIDTRTWWAIANFRETQLARIRPGMRANVYVMEKANRPFRGVVDSVGYGVMPDPDILGRITQGLPDAQRTLNWVHLASRYPVRVKVLNPPPELFRVGETAVVVLRRGELPSEAR